ncbi:MAG: DUF4062 domain-containing protein [Phycisphaerae bacterium]|nr:DUF4062 domain-containing protein [Phycisphaerae bacterium]
MEKRYTVFVSSTYSDLKNERREVMQALLELDCIPVGMELFPASDESAWSYIKQAVDDCDYYVVIIGGRYGTVGDDDDISYTEKEYDYAVSRGIPIIAFLHKDPGKIPSEKSEAAESARAKLTLFRERAEKKLCKYWTSAQDLGGGVSRSLIQLIKQKPATGWIRGDEAASPEMLAETTRLRREADVLKEELNRAKTEPPPGVERLSREDDLIPLRFAFAAYSDEGLKSLEAGTKSYLVERRAYTLPLPFTWDDAFSIVGPLLLNEADEGTMLRVLQNSIPDTLEDDWYSRHGGDRVTLRDADFQTIKVQLIAIGLIVKGDKKRAVNDTNAYWRLTPFGESHLMRLKAIPRDEGEESSSAADDVEEDDEADM